ncbi:TorF family putative porin [Sphingomonas sp.]|uniref:TorF family putative porin n=1 Tax=Sphingomonas sp. TaxID=28214 RepID=UPI0038AE4530
MSALATRVGRRPRGANGRRFGARALIAFLVASAVASSAQARVGAVVSAFSDERFRGVSLSDGRPVGTLDLSYDAHNGLYAAASGSVVAGRGEGLKLLGASVNGGYARRLRSGLTIDVGAIHSRYSRYSGLASGLSYTEVYAGLAGKLVGARISVSPDYLGSARWTTHLELNGHVDLSRRLFAEGEVGLLVPLGAEDYQGSLRPQVDARAGIARSFGTVTLHMAVTTRSRPSDFYASRGHSHTALILGISTTL